MVAGFLKESFEFKKLGSIVSVLARGVLRSLISLLCFADSFYEHYVCNNMSDNVYTKCVSVLEHHKNDLCRSLSLCLYTSALILM
jgi:hypothetical protein